ncbi:MAG TPA: response regulator [Planctomycetota bacterium]|nr:response regulator [Planctomycetota bacterium]
MKGRLLLVSTNRKSRDVLPEAIRSRAPDLAVDVAARATEALERLSGAAYDAVVCCADTPDELALVIRLKKHAPDTRVVVLSRVPDAGFEPLARSMGAQTVVRKKEGLRETSQALLRAIEAARSAKTVRREAARSKELAQDVRRLARDNRALVGMALGLAASEEMEFTTLLVEDDPLQSLWLVRQLARAKLPPFVRSVTNVSDAWDYLTAQGRYVMRSLHPFPSLIISDLHLPGESGLDLLRRVRADPATRHLGFIMLTSSERDDDIESAFASGANFYVVKTDRMEDVVDIVRTVYLRYMAERTGAKPLYQVAEKVLLRPLMATETRSHGAVPPCAGAKASSVTLCLCGQSKSSSGPG